MLKVFMINYLNQYNHREVQLIFPLLDKKTKAQNSYLIKIILLKI